MSNDVWDQLERMRLEFTESTHIQRPLLEAMIDKHKAVVAEHDALAAHVERQAKVIFDTLAAIEDGDPDAIPYDEARAVRNDTPELSLARRDIEKQAEGAAMVAESAWGRRTLAPLGGTSQERAANLATLICNDLRWRAQQIQGGGHEPH